MVLRANDTSISSNSAYVGKLYPNRYASATPDFLPVVPGSTLSYTGDASASDNRGQYIVMVHEYNDKLELIQNTTIAWSGNTAECTLQSTTKFVRFTVKVPSGSGGGSYLADGDAVEVTITPPSAT